MRLLLRIKNKVKRLIAPAPLRSAAPPAPLRSAAPPATADWNTKFDDILGDANVKLWYWPAYSNPYQSMFYGAQTPRFDPQPGAIEAALDELRSRGGHQVCFHLHWLNALFAGEDMAAKIDTFMTRLRNFCAEGGTLIWTMHNLREHDRQEGALEVKARHEIASLAGAILVHGNASRDAVQAFLPEATGKIHVIPHGNYIGVYPDVIAPTVARAELNIPPAETMFLSLGFIRKYKGLTSLCEAVKGLDAATLVVAGAVRDQDRTDLEALFTDHAQVRLFDNWIADEDLQIYLNAADFIVLPYVTSLTSGAALLALSFGVPVVAPALGPFPEVIREGETGFLYDPSNPNALKAALCKARDTRARDRAAMRVSAYESAHRLTWSTGRAVLFQILAAQHDQSGHRTGTFK